MFGCLPEDVSETPQSRILVSSCSQVLPGVSQINQAPIWMNAGRTQHMISYLYQYLSARPARKARESHLGIAKGMDP